MTEVRHYSLWIVPVGDVQNALDNIIVELGAKYSAPSFPPHVTVLGGISALPVEEETIIARSSALAATMSPFSLEFDGLDAMDEYYRCLFVRAVGTGEIMAVNSAARNAFGITDPAPFMPHLSLMYGVFPSSLKAGIIEGLKGNLPSGFTASGLSLYLTSESPEKWAVIRDFPFGKPVGPA